MNNEITCSLETTLSYENQELVYYFARQQSISIAEADDLFEDLKKWLWLCSQLDEQSETVFLFQENKILDMYWHTFLLFTENYIDFCNKYLGGIIFHKPETLIMSLSQEARVAAGDKTMIRENLQRLKSSMCEVGRILGNKTLEKWYYTLPMKYKR